MEKPKPLPKILFDTQIDPSSPDGIIAEGWQLMEHIDNLDKPVAIAQAELTGNPFHRKATVAVPDTSAPVYTKREVRIIAGFGNGDNAFEPLSKTKVTPQDLAHKKLEESGTLYDNALSGNRQLTTVQKHGSSTPFTDTSEVVRQRGGDPTYKIEKPIQSFKTRPMRNAHR